MSLRRGSRTKSILDSSINSALLAVEVHNKPRTPFRVENYISLMIIAWTKLFHAYFYKTIGSKYFYKDNKGYYKKVNGEKKAWELRKCIREYNKLSKTVGKNLEFFIKLRNKIEHRHIEKKELSSLIFGECQALLYNYENTIVELFGEEYCLNESLAFSLQFSKCLTKEQRKAHKTFFSKDAQNIYDFIQKYKNELSAEIYESQEFSVKLIAIPKVGNTSRNDLAVDFLDFESLSFKEKNDVKKLTTLVKEKKITIEAANANKYRPGQVVDFINANKAKKNGVKFNMNHHTCLWKLFGVRPPKEADEPFDTKTDYCYYDEAHNDYLYTDKWVKLLEKIYMGDMLNFSDLNRMIANNEKLKIEEFEI